MIDKKMIYEKAISEINNRRNMAKAENYIHFQEVEKNIPEISEINLQLAKTGMQIIGIIQSGENVADKIEDLKNKNLQAQKMIKSLLLEKGYPEDYLVMKHYCKKCEDTGFVENEQCECLTSLIASITAKEMNKNSQINLCSFETFDINLYYGNNQSETEQYRNIMRRIFEFCKTYAENFNENSDNIIMFGRTGLGKTHLSLAIANEVLKKGYNVLYDSSLNYLNQIEREHFGKSDGDTLSQLLSAELLILDDLGSEFTTQFYTSTIYNIINTRINRSLPTIISTNLDQDEMLKRYDERIASRLFTMYKSFELVGKDIRLIRRQKRI